MAADSRTRNQLAVIGALLIDPDSCLPLIRKELQAEDFSEPLCRAAFCAACGLADSGAVVDAVTIGENAAKLSGRADAASALYEMMLTTPTAANVEAYIDLVRQDARRAGLRSIAEMALLAVDTGDDPGEIHAELVRRLGETRREVKTKSSMDVMGHYADYYTEVAAAPDKAYCRTGFPSLDRVFGGGMFRGGVYIVGARPGMGKTTFAINIAENIARRGKRVLFFSMEMSETQIAAKRLAWQTGYNYTALMNGSISEGNMGNIAQGCQVLADEPFELCDSSALTVDGIAAVVAQHSDVECVIIDYLGLIRADNPQKTKYEAVSDISAALKAFAKASGIPLLVLAQLNRENLKRGNKSKAPQLQDLRDSGAIEQDADCVILLHRPNYYEGQSYDSEEIELYIPKNRHGICDAVTMMWKGSNGRISERPSWITGDGEE